MSDSHPYVMLPIQLQERLAQKAKERVGAHTLSPAVCSAAVKCKIPT